MTQSNATHEVLPNPKEAESFDVLENCPEQFVGELPPGNLPGGQKPGGDLPSGHFPMGEIPRGQLPDSEKIFAQRSKKRRDLIVEKALQNNSCLSSTVQNHFIQTYLSEGWGRFAHGLARQLKSPTRYGFKLVDVALIMTIYDRTIALVHPIMFAPISAPDFTEDTSMDESNIRVALKTLEQRGVLLKIKTGTINFWALNPHYFSSKTEKERGHLPLGNLPGGNPPEGNAPRVKQGDLPGVQGGQTTRGSSSQTPRNQKEISATKNLFKESKKESLLSSDFPQNMLDRWTAFQNAGLDKKIQEEREIFNKLFILHGKTFFEFCGRVIQFLEEVGNGKPGIEGKIHSPMKWIENHWDINLSRFTAWQREKDALNEAQAKKLEKEAQKKAQEVREEHLKAFNEAEDRELSKRMDAAGDRFLSVYQSEEEIESFAQEAIEASDNDYIREFWKENEWNHPSVRTCVLEYFLLVESGAVVTQVPSKTEEISA